MKHFYKKLALACLATTLSTTSFSQKLLWTSQYGGENSNGAIIQYDLSNSELTTKYSLVGNPLIGSEVFFNQDNWSHPGAFMQGADGMIYGVSDLNTIGSTRDEWHGYKNNTSGVFYKMNPNNGEIEILHVFEGNREYTSVNPTSGLSNTDSYQGGLFSPIHAPVELTDGVFYGLTNSGGDYGHGGIYKFDTNNSLFEKVASFDPSIHGENVYSPLVQGDGENFYGILESKSGGNDGYLYRLDRNTNQLDFVRDLSSANIGVLWVINHPYGSMVYDNVTNKLIGVKDRFDSDSNWGGGCWAYNISTGDLENRFTITYSELGFLGSQPQGIIQANNGKLYIVTTDGGSNGNGTIIQYDIQSNSPIKVADFPSYSASNSFPSGEGLQAIGSKIYGFYELSGSDGKNTMWSFDVTNNQLTSFCAMDNSSHGSEVQTSFVSDNGNLILRSVTGGSGDVGSFFKYNESTAQSTIISSNASSPGRQLVGNTALIGHKLIAIVNKGGDNISDYSESGGFLTLDLTNNDASFHNRKDVQLRRDIVQTFSTGAVNESTNEIFYVTNLETGFNYAKKLVSYNYGNNSNRTIKFLEHNTFLTEPLLTNNKLYVANADSIYTFNTNSGQFTTIGNIADATTNGKAIGSLTLASDGHIYGITSNILEPTAKTSIFKLDTTNQTINIIAEFDTQIRNLNAQLIEYQGKLYGISNYGGTNSNGFIFSLDLSNNQIDTLYNIDGTNDGRVFEGAFTEHNGLLYAVSFSGGQNGNGTLISFDPNTNTFITIESLDITNGRAFKATPIVSNYTLSTTPITGNSDLKSADLIIYPNPSNDFISIKMDGFSESKVYSSLGTEIKVKAYDNVLDVQNLESGLYIVKIIDEQGIEYNSTFIKN